MNKESTIFLGKTSHNLDNKGRLKLPSKFIKNLKEKIYLNVSIWGECLEVITQTTFEKRYQYLNTFDEFNQSASEIKMFLNASTFEIKLDSVGRINIPHEVLSNLKFSKKVYVIGNGDRIVIWDQVRYQKKYEQAQKKIHLELKNFAEKLTNTKQNEKD